jgi:hypothetical protein
MQPYFLPYIGYFQLMRAVDLFVVYDEVKYTKRGWINRNRFLLNDKDEVFSLPLKSASDSHTIAQRQLADDFDRAKLLNRLLAAYRKAPCRDQTQPLLETVIGCHEANLFRYIHHSILRTSRHVSLETEVRVSSTIPFDPSLRAQEKVLAICEAVGADCYINPIGGTELYSPDVFASRGIELRFLKSRAFEYRQFDNEFVPWLSILDVLMFNPLAVVRDCLERQYDLI